MAVGFFCPVKLPASYIAHFQKAPNMEHFALGDKYDVVQDGSSILTVTVTTLIGFESDEGGQRFVHRRFGYLGKR
jgi:hypothetical protein